MLFERSPYISSDEEDVDISAFRRVHINLFEGDLLCLLVKIST